MKGRIKLQDSKDAQVWGKQLRLSICQAVKVAIGHELKHTACRAEGRRLWWSYQQSAKPSESALSAMSEFLCDIQTSRVRM